MACNNQRGRRNLAQIDRVALGAKYLEIEKRLAKERQQKSGERHGRGQKVEEIVPQPIERAPQARDLAAAAVGISSRQLEKGLEVIKKSAPEVIEQIRNFLH